MTDTHAESSVQLGWMPRDVLRNRGPGHVIRLSAAAVGLAVSLIASSSAAPAAQLERAPLVDALRGGGYVVYFRHAATDFSQEDTDIRNLANCRTQRNLTAQGRADARVIGRAFRTLRIPVGTVLASKFCRTRETARLAFGRVRTTIDLTSLATSATDRERKRRIAALRRLLGTRPRARTNTVLVSHGFNIEDAANLSLEEGEAAIFRPRGQGRFRLIGRVLPRAWLGLRRFAARRALSLREYSVPDGSHPHDVAPAKDGGVWYTAQASGDLGWLDPKTGKTEQLALGQGSAPHGVIVGPDGAPWITDGGLNAIVRVDPASRRVRRFPLPSSKDYANLNTATFDRHGVLWFTGQSGIYGRLDPKDGKVRVFPAPRGAGPYGITTTPGGAVYYASLAGSYLGRIDVRRGTATVLRPPTRDQGARRVWSDARGRLWISEWNAGKLGRYDPRTRRWREWRLPGVNPMPYAVFVGDGKVWLSDFGANALVRFDPATSRFTRVRLPSAGAEVRQLHGRPGEVWGAESGTDKLVVVRTR
jgi:virginiamycin B lyase